MRWTGRCFTDISSRCHLKYPIRGGRMGAESSPGDKRYLISAAGGAPRCRDASLAGASRIRRC